MQDFFSTDETQNLITKFNATKYDADNTEYTSELLNLVESLKVALNFLDDNKKIADTYCQFNIKHIDKAILKYLSSCSSSTNNTGDTLLLIALIYRVAIEYSLHNPNSEYYQALIIFRQRVEEYTQFDETSEEQVKYAQTQMYLSIFGNQLKSLGLSNIEDYENRLNGLQTKTNQLSSEVINKTNELKNLEDRVAGISDKTNFIELNKGFEELEQEKNSELNRLNWSIFGFGLIMIMLLVSQLFPILRISNDTTTPGELVKLFPLISLEIILIYFFRIALVERKISQSPATTNQTMPNIM